MSWRLSELPPPAADAPLVFSCFHCGGGSTMGYKLAGFRVLGGVEIDPKMMTVYRLNHKPELSYLMGVQDFVQLPDDKLDSRLFELDILDGSPPCSSFSMAGVRERKWGVRSKFREGQVDQVLDDLFFHFIALGKRLQPRVIVAENVKGLLIGKAKGYVKEIFAAFRDAGYTPQLFLLNAATMGVPQRRERTFFVARRNDLDWPQLALRFNERQVSVRDALKGCKEDGAPLCPAYASWWNAVPEGKNIGSIHPNGSMFSAVKLDPKRPSNTVDARCKLMHWKRPRHLSRDEVVRLQSFPDDYNFGAEVPHYICGMSVPPLMMRGVASEVRRQWLDAR